MFGQVIRFLGVGGIATLLHVLAAILAHSLLPISEQRANLIGFGAAFGVSYLGHAFFTFGTGLTGWTGFARFLFVALAGLLCSSTIVWFTTEWFNGTFSLAMLAVGFVVPVASFIALRLWVFADRSGHVGPTTSDLGVILGLASTVLLVFWNEPVNHDIAWYLFATRNWLSGTELYSVIVEVNPPLNFYLTVPAIEIADVLGISDSRGHYLAIITLLVLSLFWTAMILRTNSALDTRRRVLLLAGTGLAVLLPSLNGFGQREQIMVLCLFPWAFGEAVSQQASRGQRAARAIFASVGICLKPHFVLFPIAVAVLNCVRVRSARPILAMENLIYLAVGASYVAFVYTVHPAYLSDIVPIALEVYQAYGTSFRQVLSGMAAPVGMIILTTAIYWRQGSASRSTSVFLALACGGLLSYFLQGTGFSYHKVPFLTFSAIACYFMMIETPPGTVQHRLAAVIVLAIGGLGLAQGFYRNNATAEVVSTVLPFGKVDGLLTLSSHVYTGPPVAIALGTDWLGSYPANWLVPGAINRLAAIDCASDREACATLSAILDQNRSAIIADIAGSHPELIIVDRSSGYFDEPGFDWLGFMAEDPDWAHEFAAYKKLAVSGRFLYFRRIDDGT
jgi:putative flippase GtrA